MNKTNINCISIYQQPFCHYKNKREPKQFADSEYDNLEEYLELNKKNIKKKSGNDLIFTRILFVYLMFPIYFSIKDYSKLALCFKGINKNIINKVANGKYPLIINAYKVAKITSLGLHNFINLFFILSEICGVDVRDQKGKNIYDYFIEDLWVVNSNIYGLSYKFNIWLNDVLGEFYYDELTDESDDLEEDFYYSDSDFIIFN